MMDNYFYVFSATEKNYLRNRGVRHKIAVTVAATSKTFWGYKYDERLQALLQELALKRELEPRPKVEVEQVVVLEQTVDKLSTVEQEQEQELRLALQQAFDIGEGDAVAETDN